jgi:hypothetical protein
LRWISFSTVKGLDDHILGTGNRRVDGVLFVPVCPHSAMVLDYFDVPRPFAQVSPQSYEAKSIVSYSR